MLKTIYRDTITYPFHPRAPDITHQDPLTGLTSIYNQREDMYILSWRPLVFSFCTCTRVPPVTTNKSDLKLYLPLLFKLNPFQIFPMGMYTPWMQTGLTSLVMIVMLHPICVSITLFYPMIWESWSFANSPLTRLWTWNTTTTSTIRVSLLI